MAETYSAGNIRVLEGLDAVRLRPGMYIGTTGVKGLHHILWEIVDNAIDEVSNGFATSVLVTIHRDGSASVEDDGRGIPVDIHPQLGVSGVEVVFTQLHAGGKFDTSNYAHSGGLHGVGASVTNALSEWLRVEVRRDGKVYRMEFESKEVNGEVKGGLPKYHLIETGETTDKHGSTVRFMPDKRIFETVVFQFDVISRRLKELAFLNKGVRIKLVDERVAVGDGYRSLEYCYDGGIIDFVKYINEARSTLYDEPVMIKGARDGISMELAFQHTDAYTENLFSYVNNIPTTEGGTHETGFKAAYTKVMNDFARRVGMLKEKDQNLLGDDYREGLTAVLSVQMTNVQFEGQTKTKLGNPAARVAIDGLVSQLLSEYFALPENENVGEAILKKGMLAAKVREAARKEKEITRAKNAIDNFNLVGKLTPCTGKKPENNELFIVEGDSAGGTCKQARARSYQAVLPLRGKPLNAEKKRIDQVLANEEIRTLISALGSGIGEDFNIDNLNYHKVVILSDADVDGYHIRAILLTFFFRYMKDLINEGKVYIGLPPLYKIEKGNQVEYAYDDAALAEAKTRFGKGAIVQRYKGLGEMDTEQLWETTMDPERRALMQVTIDDAAEAEKLVSVLMGDAVELRREYIIENADFNKVDEFKGSEK
ncbi:MAG: type IIA DNA topoisomerase subunit B [Clostridia bacterium]|nr:type IIA DNA topoisomerase subunit B [Clostridia bacterium]MCI9458834.1 type IIA DNA topoisomerase subunit B [Clostridia bacterium]